jgi:membrane-bound lytic murein transglycosylase F
MSYIQELNSRTNGVPGMAKRLLQIQKIVGISLPRWLAAMVVSALIGAPGQLHAEAANGPRLQVDEYSDRYDGLFRHYSKRYFGPFVDWRWFKAQAVAESRLNAEARSPANARGLMQLLPSTFREVSRGRPEWGDIHSPRANVAAGLTYNHFLYRKWNGIFDGPDRLLLALSSYNAGFYRVRAAVRDSERVRSWDDIKAKLPGETRAYIARIRELMQPIPEPAPELVAAAALP